MFDLKQSSLKNIEPNLHLKISLSIIYYMGTWPPEKNYRSLYIVYTSCIFIFMLGICLLTEIAHLILNWGDMNKIIAGATLLMTNSTHASKVIIFLIQQKRIQALLDTVHCELFNGKNPNSKKVQRLYTLKGIFHHIAYQSFGAAAVFCWGFTPIADMIAGRSRQLPMEGWYPYNTTKTPAFEITAAHQAIAVIMGCFHNVAMDTLVTGFITVACCQLTLLKENAAAINISEINNEDVIKNDDIWKLQNFERKNKEESENALKICVTHSNMIFDFAKNIEDIFGTVIFFQLLVNCIIVCLIAFNISQMQVYIPSVVIGMLMYMCCMTYQIFVYCWHGNELHLHSLDVALGAYSSDWWNAKKGFKQAVQIIVIRSQRPLSLKVGNIMLLSLNTFVRVLRMSYSIFTVLQSRAD